MTEALRVFRRSKTRTGRRDLFYNLHRFQDLVYSEDAAVVCVNETWFNNTVDNCEVLHNDYTIYRKDRIDSWRSVDCLKDRVFQEVTLPVDLHELEIVSAVVTTATGQKILFCSCYHPDSDTSWAVLFDNFLDFACDKFESMLICSDFHLPKIPWDTPDCVVGTN